MTPRAFILGLCLAAALASSARAQGDILQTLDRGEILYRQKRFAEARPQLEQVLAAIDAGTLAEDAYLGRCLLPLVKLHVAEHEFDKAVPRAERILTWLAAQPPNDSLEQKKLDYRVLLGDAHAGLGNLPAAQAEWKRAIESSHSVRDATDTWRLTVQWKMLDPRTNPQASPEDRERLAEAARARRQRLDVGKRRSAEFHEAAELEGLAYAALDQPAQAAEAYRARLTDLANHAPDQYVSVLMQLAVWEREAAQYEKAEKHLREALANRRAVAFVREVYEQLGRTLKAAGKPREAEACWRKLLELEQAAPPTKPTLAQRVASLERMRLAQEELQDYPHALQTAETLWDVLQKSPHAAPEATRRARLAVGTLAAATGDYARADELLAASVAELRSDRTREREPLIRALTALGNVKRKIGQSEEAERLFREALALCTANEASDHLQLAEARSNLAAVVAERGRYAEAISLLQEALAGAEKSGASGVPLRGALLEFLAITYFSQGQLDRAAEQITAALAMEADGPTQDVARARRMMERYEVLAKVELALKRIDEAALACDQAIALAASAKLQGEPGYSRIQRRAGTIALERGDLDKAEKNLLAALAAEQKRSARADAARTLADLADLAVRRRQFDVAEQRYREALAQQSDVYARPILHYNILGNLGQLLYYAKGDQAGGLKLLKQAAGLLEIPRAATTGGGEQQRAEFLARHAAVYDLLVDNSLAAGDVAEAFRYAELARNRTFLDQLQLAGVDLRATLPESVAKKLVTREAELAAQLTSAREAATRSLHAHPHDDANKKFAENVRKLQHEYAQAWGEIRDASPFYREVLERRQQIGDLAEVQRTAVAADGLMLFYVLGDFQSHLLLIGHEPGDVTVIDLALPESLQREWKAESPALTRRIAVRLVNEYLAALRSVAGGRGLAGMATSPKGYMEAERGQLVTEILLPSVVRKRIAERAPSHLIVVPDGALHELPLECLVISPGTRPVFALDTLPPLCYAPSATILLSLMQRQGAEAALTGPMLLSVGNPEYAVADANLPASATREAFLDFGGQLAPLPGTQRECQRAADAFGEGASQLLLGSGATESAVRNAIAGRRYVHLAAHGLVDERDDNLFGAIALTPPSRVSVDEDGFLALHEIYALNLRGCELAALSACQTNVGGDRPLEAGSTLARAFLAAGARRVVCSHWNVDDEAGSELIATLWEEIAAAQKQGAAVDYAQALRDAQRRIRQRPEFASAYHWAPFVLIGPPTAAR